jgi:hypothetical protein
MRAQRSPARRRPEADYVASLGDLIAAGACVSTCERDRAIRCNASARGIPFGPMASKSPTRRTSCPFQLLDPVTNVAYVLVRADVYAHMVGNDAYDPRDSYPFVEEVMREDDKRDPLLQSYQGVTSRKRR